MTDKPTHQDRLKTILHQDKKATPPKKDADAEEMEVSCGAFGYLRGIRDQAGAVPAGDEQSRETEADSASVDESNVHGFLQIGAASPLRILQRLVDGGGLLFVIEFSRPLPPSQRGLFGPCQCELAVRRAHRSIRT